MVLKSVIVSKTVVGAVTVCKVLSLNKLRIPRKKQRTEVIVSVMVLKSVMVTVCVSIMVLVTVIGAS